MLFYTALILLAIFCNIKYPKNKTGLLWILILCYLSMFRAETVGTDTSNYMEYTDNIEKFILIFGQGFEIGRAIEFSYLLIIFFLYGFDLSPRFLIVIMSVITFLFLYLTLKKSKLSYSIAVLIFLLLFYFPSLNIARQICACSIILYAYTFLFEKGKRKFFYFFYIILATSFHASSILYLAGYLIHKIKTYKFNKKTLSIFAICLFFFNSLFPIPISEWAISFFGSLSYSELYADQTVSQARSLFGILYSFIQITPYIFIFNKCSKNKLDKFDFIYYCSIISLIISSTANSDFARIFLPLQFFQIIYICHLYKSKRLKITGQPFLYFIMVNTLLTLYSLSTGAGELVPYIIDYNFN